MHKLVQTVLALACVLCAGADVYKPRLAHAITDRQARGSHAVKALADLLLLCNSQAAFRPAGPEVSFRAATPTVASTHRRSQVGRAFAPKMSTPLTELTPAVDKFPLSPSEADVELSIRADQKAPKGPDPFKLIEKDLKPVTRALSDLIESNPILKKSASRFMAKKQGKQYHATTVAMVGRALSKEDAPESMASRQLQLAQVTEMIQVANLVHEKINDDREMKEVQMLVLAGDYLLSKASVALAGLQDQQVVELIASALASTVEGRWMEGEKIPMQAETKEEVSVDIDHYLRRTYLKTASLFSLGCKSSALLAGYQDSDAIITAAEAFGYHLGMAYQIVEDILDFKEACAKPKKAEIGSYLLSAPILYASEAEPSLKAFIERSFENDGDIQKAIEIAKDTDGMSKSYNLAEFHAHKALDALTGFSDSESREALVILVHRVLSRK